MAGRPKKPSVGMRMTFVVTSACDPDERIERGVRTEKPPAKPIHADKKPDLDQWPVRNARYARGSPNITPDKNPPTDADAWLYKSAKIAELLASPAND